MRIEPKAWGPAADSPTFLPPDALTIEKTQPRPARQPKAEPRQAEPRQAKSDSIITSAPAPKAKQPKAQPAIAKRPSESTVKPLPAPPAGPAPRGSDPVVAQPPVQAPGPVATPSSPVIAPPRAVSEPYIQFEGGASFDPLALPLPPDLAPPVYDWLRRLALQAELPGADKLLRDAFADVTSSLSCLIIYSGPDGLHTLGANDEMPADQSPIVAVARSRRALCTTHSAFVPIATTTETIAVVVLTRNSRQPAFNMVDNVLMAGVARESASIMHHLVVQHLQRRNEAEADKKSLYRPEALESHRRRGQEGVVTELSPGWVRRTYWVLVASILAGLVFTTLVHVPTYSTGTGIVIYPGTPVSAPAAGTVDEVYVQAQQAVHKGDPLIRLKSDKEEADLRQAEAEESSVLHQYMFDRSDEQVRKSLFTAQAAKKRAEDALAQRTVLAPADGTVPDIHIRKGTAVEFGTPLLSIVAPGTKPEVWAYMPASDQPRLHKGNELIVAIGGFEKTPEKAKIYSVERTAVSVAEAKRQLGPELGDSIKLPPETSIVIVKATLPSTKFRAKGIDYLYHGGMQAKTEVRVESKRFIVTLLPSLEKYVP